MFDILSAFIRSHLVTQHSTVSETHAACSISTQSDRGKHVCLPLLTASHYLLHISFENVLTNTASTTNSRWRGGEDSSFASAVFVFRLCCLLSPNWQNVILVWGVLSSKQRFFQHAEKYKAVNLPICGYLRLIFFFFRLLLTFFKTFFFFSSKQLTCERTCRLCRFLKACPWLTEKTDEEKKKVHRLFWRAENC